MYSSGGRLVAQLEFIVGLGFVPEFPTQSGEVSSGLFGHIGAADLADGVGPLENCFGAELGFHKQRGRNGGVLLLHLGFLGRNPKTEIGGGEREREGLKGTRSCLIWGRTDWLVFYYI